MKKSSHQTVICFGEILWDILPDGPQPGGAPLNVAYHLKKLGIEASILSRIGVDDEGKQLQNLLTNWQINQQLLQLDAEHPTGKVIASLNNIHEVSYEILFPTAWDFIEPISKPLEADYLVFGSLASRNEITKNTLLALLEQPVTKVFDINLRPPFYEKNLLLQLLAKADIVKFNEAELKEVSSFFGNTLTQEMDQVKLIQDKFNIEEIIVTKGSEGASYFLKDKIHHAKATPVKVQDTIGSGDAFLATFISGHALKENPEDMIKNAAAMGAFIATQKGGCPPYDLAEFLNFKQSSK